MQPQMRPTHPLIESQVVTEMNWRPADQEDPLSAEQLQTWDFRQSEHVHTFCFLEAPMWADLNWVTSNCWNVNRLAAAVMIAKLKQPNGSNPVVILIINQTLSEAVKIGSTSKKDVISL
jgi:hypothetical protein